MTLFEALQKAKDLKAHDTMRIGKKETNYTIDVDSHRIKFSDYGIPAGIPYNWLLSDDWFVVVPCKACGKL